MAAAQETGSPAAGEALAGLCRAYWYPLFAYIGRRGQSPEDAQDLTREFFAGLLQKRALRGMDRGKGKFRAFLLACCYN